MTTTSGKQRPSLLSKIKMMTDTRKTAKKSVELQREDIKENRVNKNSSVQHKNSYEISMKAFN